MGTSRRYHETTRIIKKAPPLFGGAFFYCSDPVGPPTVRVAHVVTKSHFRVDKNIIHADPLQIHQILMNICHNAAQAMALTGGVIDITVANEEVHNSINASLPDLVPGELVKISIADTGPGIAADIMDRIFDPYFTTKEVGKGSGLGLSTVQGMVRQSGGIITADNQREGGALFTIYFPLVKE